MPPILSDLFCRAEADRLADLEERLATLIAAARSAWPAIRIDDATWISYLRAHLPDPPALGAALRAVHGPDLLLACGCAHGDRAALEAFDRELMAPIARLPSFRRDPVGFAEEVCQVLRERLLVAAGRELPRISEFDGRGTLAGWLRVVAVRAANRMRKARVHEPLDEAEGRSPLGSLPPGANPELDYLRARHGQELLEALRAATAELDDDERALLRHYYRERLTVDQIALRLGVDKSTVSRRLGRCNERLLRRTEARLRERLRLRPDEVESMVELVRSRLEVSLSGLLRSS